MSTTTKVMHTPGPWEYAYGAVYDKQGVPIGKADRDTPYTQPVERDANARLMAAAPELLQALEDVSNAYQEHFDVMPVAWQTIDNIVQDAIRKARGE